jgi:acetolactate synthase-1/2/3 large subunit
MSFVPFYVVRGEGPELVLFVHAVGGDHRSWEAQLEALPARYTGAALDLRGHSRSFYPGAAEDVSIETFARDSLSLIEELGFASAHLVGLSMGAVVVQEMYKQAPQKALSLTLCDTWCFHPEADARRAFMRDKLARMSMQESASADMPYLYAPDAPPEMIARAAEIEGGKDKAVFLRSWDLMFQVDYRELLPRVSVPVLLVGGSEDKITPVDPLLTEIKARVPMAELAVLPGGGHFCNVDRAAAFNEVLWSFLQRTRSPETRISPPAWDAEFLPEADNTAEALLQLLSQRGVRFLFSNSGTDFTPIIDALARYQHTPGFSLRVVMAPHEQTLPALAHGAFLVSGEPQSVMAHVTVGSANLVMGAINARRSRVPMLLMAGRTPHYESDREHSPPGGRSNFVQWGQDSFDQAGPLREYTKWDYELRSGHALDSVVDRALAGAQSPPAGPVYLTLPLEVLRAPLDRPRFAASPRQRPNPASTPDHLAVSRVSRLLKQAKKPLILTAELGRYPGGPEALWQLAVSHGIPVVEFGKRNFFNLSTECPMHQGFWPSPLLEEADLVIAVENPVPYLPSKSKLAKHPLLVQIAVDPLFQDIPMRSFPTDIALAGDPARSLLALLRELGEASPEAVARRSHWEERHRAVFSSALARAAQDAALPRISKRFLSYCVGQAIDDQVTVFNEYPLDHHLVPRRLPGSWFENSIASGLGWALGAAVGGKLADPARVALAAVGDGVFLFNSPLSALHVAAAERAPILVVVFNDQAYSTIKNAHRDQFPRGWAARNNTSPLVSLAPEVKFEQVAEACGGIGLRVESPGALPAALSEGLRLVRSQERFVLLNVLCEPDA